MRIRKIPRGARILRTYAEFQSYLADFVEGRYPFVWIVGRPGATKTESIRAALRGRPCYYRKGGTLTALQFYLDCHRHRGLPIILDDAEHLLAKRDGAKLVSAMGDTSAAKQMNYGSTSGALGDVPPVYFTTSPLCIIANKATADEAIQSRAVLLHFDPTNCEIHRAVAQWFWDVEIHGWFGQHLSRLRPIDARSYVIAWRDKRAGRDWRRIILEAHGIDRASTIVQDLETDQAYPLREAKADRFFELVSPARGASRMTYFRIRRRLEQEGRLVVAAEPPIPLRRTRPPTTPSLMELDALADEAAMTEEEATAADVPARAAFQRPITGAPLNAPAGVSRPSPYRADDRLGWEPPEGIDDEAGPGGDGEEDRFGDT